MGEPVGSLVGDAEGDVVGLAVVGSTVGCAVVVVGSLVMGSLVDICVGARVVGTAVGLRVVGFLVGLAVVGLTVEDFDGDADRLVGRSPSDPFAGLPTGLAVSDDGFLLGCLVDGFLLGGFVGLALTIRTFACQPPSLGLSMLSKITTMSSPSTPPKSLIVYCSDTWSVDFSQL